ncbi:hypothetical protein VNO78_18621 [Psophocarpus tetragonolobus]|uniref:Transmembrane protein n=1 Tax=Psophocarpus tetragonolobus TaxID=3891 RepID=A0AAN9SIS7_PSOTE
MISRMDFPMCTLKRKEKKESKSSVSCKKDKCLLSCLGVQVVSRWSPLPRSDNEDEKTSVITSFFFFFITTLILLDPSLHSYLDPPFAKFCLGSFTLFSVLVCFKLNLFIFCLNGPEIFITCPCMLLLESISPSAVIIKYEARIDRLVMAGAEARALWQRTANRCFVQEDAKRAPKLACCQSSCATSKSVDAGPASTADESDHTTVNVNHFNRKSSISNLSPDSRWWLHLQPNYGYQKGLTYEQLNALEDEVETLVASDVSKNSEEFQELMDVTAKHETMDINCVGCSEFSKKTNDFSLESDYSWIESDKAEPWWRTTYRDELASFVSQKSLNHIENCDLPPPQKKHLRGHPCACVNKDKIKTTSYDWEAKSRNFSNLTAHTQESLDPGPKQKDQGPPANEGFLYFAGKCSSHTPEHEDIKKCEQIYDGDPSKAQLMEALCHSQTRAREAEEAAKKAYAEKEHIVTLIFKQASQLFAYKQWLQLLQLETLCSQIRNKDQPISTRFPVALPRMSYEIRSSRKRKKKSNAKQEERRANSKCDITTYAVAFALGLSLVGAGLLLGWTVGWMLPRS